MSGSGRETKWTNKKPRRIEKIAEHIKCLENSRWRKERKKRHMYVYRTCHLYNIAEEQKEKENTRYVWDTLWYSHCRFFLTCTGKNIVGLPNLRSIYDVLFFIQCGWFIFVFFCRLPMSTTEWIRQQNFVYKYMWLHHCDLIRIIKRKLFFTIIQINHDTTR